jgi:hypothetical protein
MGKKKSQADLFLGMTPDQIDSLCITMGNIATREDARGNYDMASDFNDIWLDLDIAWWRRKASGKK